MSRSLSQAVFWCGRIIFDIEGGEYIMCPAVSSLSTQPSFFDDNLLRPFCLDKIFAAISVLQVSSYPRPRLHTPLRRSFLSAHTSPPRMHTELNWTGKFSGAIPLCLTIFSSLPGPITSAQPYDGTYAPCVTGPLNFLL